MNKKYLNSVLFAFFLFFMGGISAQKSQTVVFQTSAQCGMCKDRIEGVMNFVPGVKYAELNMKDMSLSIKYNSKKVTPADLRKRVADIGYSADAVKPKEEDVKKLPLCCQPGAHI
jgi:copper chaperone CopZ